MVRRIIRDNLINNTVILSLRTHRNGHDREAATGAFRRVHPVIVANAENLTVHIHREALAVQTFLTHGAAEAARMVRLPQSREDLQRE